MLTKVFGSAVFGVEAQTITVEVNVDKGVGYHLVGLPDNAIKESNYRIAAALKNNGHKIPGKKITINMAPADMRKEGSAYDLTLAIGILVASAQIQAQQIDNYVIMGELSLDGAGLIRAQSHGVFDRRHDCVHMAQINLALRGQPHPA